MASQPCTSRCDPTVADFERRPGLQWVYLRGRSAIAIARSARDGGHQAMSLSLLERVADIIDDVATPGSEAANFLGRGAADELRGVCA